MRCNDCNKFVSNGEPEATVENGEDFEVELSEGKLIVKVSPEVRVVIPCGECGRELKDTTFSCELETEHTCDKLPKEEPDEGITIEGTVEVEAIDDYQTKDRHGKEIKNPRYQTHLYGASVVATATCPFCQGQIEITESDSVAASGMDELQ